MKISFENIPRDLLEGIKEVSPILGIEEGSGGISVKAVPNADALTVRYENSAARISYSKKVEFFRGLSLLAEHLPEGIDFEIHEKAAYDSLSALFDNSRNGVLKVGAIKKMLSIIALMGFDTLMLYTEDTFEVKGYPYFGHMRGRFTPDEIRGCDRYAAMFGIELVPCIQTLAHLNAAFKWQQFQEINDCDDILLIGDDRTYELLDAMFCSLSKMYTSRRINIGMDEAHMVGLGKYLDRCGYQQRFDVMIGHLERVIGICKKYGFKPAMWSDMFFRLIFSSYYDTAEIDEKLMEKVPKEISLAYWDYYSQDKSTYDRNIEKHLKFKNEIIFAGGAWKWMGFAPCNQFSFKTSRMALESCREHGIKNVIATGWSDNGAECSSFSSLPVLQLYAEDCYETDTSDMRIAKRLYTCAGANMSDFMNLDMPNLIKGNEAPGGSSINPSKYLLFQDVLCGLFEKHTEIGTYNSFYHEIAIKAEEAAARNREWAYIFKTSAALSHVLEIKCDIGLRLREAYHKKDNEQLRSLSENELAELLSRIETMHEVFREQWDRENKVFGFDVQDIRFGALKERVKSAKKRIDSYLSNEIERIEEFEIEPLDFWCRADENATPHISANVWQDIVTANII